MPEGSKQRSQTAERLEWALGVACGLLVLTLAGFLVREGISDGQMPPRLSVTTRPGADEIRFTVRNDGGRTATAVAVALREGDGGERRLVIDYVPGHSEASGGFVLPPGTSADGMEIVVEGYIDP